MPKTPFTPFPARTGSSPSLFAIGVLLAALASQAVAQGESRLQVPHGFQAIDLVHNDPHAFIGGLAVHPDGRLVLFNGTSVVLLGGDGAPPTVLFTPDAPDGLKIFGNFLRLAPDGATVYFGENREASSTLPHNIYQVPLDPASGEPGKLLGSIQLNFDLAFDGQGRAFVSAFDLGSASNTIFLLGGDPAAPSPPVITGIPGSSGPLAFHDGRLYYATAKSAPDENQVVYFTSAQLEAAIGSGQQIDFGLATIDRQVVASLPNTYYNLVFIGDRLFASDSIGGLIDQVLPDGTIETFATVPLEGGANGSVTYLAYRPGGKEFQASVGPEGGSLYAIIGDYSTFNDLVEVIPQLYFRRGYVNGDAVLDLSDAISLLGYLYLDGGAPDPLEAADVNADGKVDLSDPIYLLDYLFKGGPRPPEPFLEAGPGPKGGDA